MNALAPPRGAAGLALPPLPLPLTVVEPLRVRRLGTADLPAVERHLLSLGPEDRRSRFLSRLGDGPISAYVRGLDPARALLFGALEVSSPSGELLGLAEAHPAGQPGRVELAVSVRPSHRRLDLGRHLVERALAAAFAAGAEAGEFVFAPDNLPLLRLLGALGARIGPVPGLAVVRRDGWAPGVF